ncbi:endonuclease domain-containing protein [Pseudonocardia pini]|uniref:endonuclease domain-containing protein n=1 Tax=Pseudonocardia pini TaxID=2758030 RepID=UPI001C68BEE8|nr:DUF559 domain-containing protein [Pseudonocardia pini]
MAPLLRRQAGVISRAQAVAVGVSPDAVDRNLAARRWVPLHPRVYRDDAHPPSDAARVWAAVLWAGEGAVLSGVAAAWWQGIAPALAGPVAVTVPRRRSPRPRQGVTVRRRDLDPQDRTHRHGVAVTAPAFTVLDAAVELGTAGGPFLDRALQTGVSFEAVSRAYSRNIGCHGSAAMHALLVAAADRSASVAERLLVKHLRAARLIGWRCGHPVMGFLLDLAFPEAKVAIEVDGWAWHLDAERRQRDLWRQNVLVRAGWTVLRYTWQDLTTRPAAVLAEIGHAVATARRAS